MKKYFITLALLFSGVLSAQSIVQGTIATTGKTITDSGSGVSINFTLGQPFGGGESGSNDIVIIGGLQGASGSIVDNPGEEDPGVEPLGIGSYDLLDATLTFDPSNGTLMLSGTEVSEISGTLLVSDLNGKILSTGRIENGQLQVEQVKHSVTGVLIVSIFTDDQKRLSKKLIF